MKKTIPEIVVVLMIIPIAFWMICGIGWIVSPDIFLGSSYESIADGGWENFKFSNKVISMLQWVFVGE